MGEKERDLKLYELEEVCKHITYSPVNEYFLLDLQKKDNESDVQSSLRVPLVEGPNDT